MFFDAGTGSDQQEMLCQSAASTMYLLVTDMLII